MKRRLFDEEHEMFRDSVRKWIASEVAPHAETWRQSGQVSKEAWKSAGEKGFLAMFADEKYGGMGLDEGLCEALRESLAKMKGMDNAKVVNHPDSIYAGAIGAALWGAFRFDKLAASGQLLKAS